ncbi:MAG: hypothetical protein V1860_01965, partial [bacterium]
LFFEFFKSKSGINLSEIMELYFFTPPKYDIYLIKNELKCKVDFGEFRILQKKVFALEAKVGCL